jgi:hypothetical protein
MGACRANASLKVEAICPDYPLNSPLDMIEAVSFHTQQESRCALQRSSHQLSILFTTAFIQCRNLGFLSFVTGRKIARRVVIRLAAEDSVL